MGGSECEQCSQKKRFALQPKLKVSEPGDIYEQEADRVADQVMAASTHSAVSSAPPRIQRLAGQPVERASTAPSRVNQALASPGHPLAPPLRQDMEQRFGYDFSHVRVHSGGVAEQSAEDVNANAYTVGHDIVFGEGLFAPGTHQGRRLVAHELTHVVQQSGSLSQAGSQHQASQSMASDSGAIHQPSTLTAHVARDDKKKRSSGFRVRKSDLDALSTTMRSLVDSVDDSTRKMLLIDKTVAIGLVLDPDGKPTLVYTVNNNWTNAELEAAANKLGITRWLPTARAEGTRADIGAAGDAEQLMVEGAEANDFKIKAIAVSRPMCKHCKLEIKHYERGRIRIVEVRFPSPRRSPTGAGGGKTGTGGASALAAPAPVVSVPRSTGKRGAGKAPPVTTSAPVVSTPKVGKGPARGFKLRSAGKEILGDVLLNLSSAMVDVGLAVLEHEVMEKDIQENVIPHIEPALPSIEPKLELLRQDTSQLPIFFLSIKYRLHYERKTIYTPEFHGNPDQGINLSYHAEFIEVFHHSEFDSLDVSRDAVEGITKLKDLVHLVTYSEPLEIELTAEEIERLQRHTAEISREINARARPKFEECVKQKLARPAGMPTEEERAQAEEKCMKETGYVPWMEGGIDTD